MYIFHPVERLIHALRAVLGARRAGVQAALHDGAGHRAGAAGHVTESARACSYFSSSQVQKKWLLPCWLFKFGCSGSLPLYIVSKSV